ncbi:hypothetical protein JTE90_021609 [Oedothorax gibbosus]|uniref:Uncharacterized protein n=1 Tax=Oedothorax gibbosus TaxID=931172 RepID=A0AAV6VRH8_9ARAC|nr:hypothetical protein JTE90_021609 [Oedothorax gibbosus]
MKGSKKLNSPSNVLSLYYCSLFGSTAYSIEEANAYLDSVFEGKFKEEIEYSRLDPYKFPDIHVDLISRRLTENNANLTMGKLHNLSKIRRSGDCTQPIWTFANISFTCHLRFDLTLNYTANVTFDNMQLVFYPTTLITDSSVTIQVTSTPHENIPNLKVFRLISIGNVRVITHMISIGGVSEDIVPFIEETSVVHFSSATTLNDINSYVDEVLSVHVSSEVESFGLLLYELPNFHFVKQHRTPDGAIANTKILFHAGNLTGLQNVNRKSCHEPSWNFANVSVVCNFVLPQLDVKYEVRVDNFSEHQEVWNFGKHEYGMSVVVQDAEFVLEITSSPHLKFSTIKKFHIQKEGDISIRFDTEANIDFVELSQHFHHKYSEFFKDLLSGPYRTVLEVAVQNLETGKWFQNSFAPDKMKLLSLGTLVGIILTQAVLVLSQEACNEYVDKILRDLKEDKEIFQDPYQIPEKTVEVHKKVLLINYTGEASIYDGYVYGLQTLHRDGDVIVDKQKKTHLKVYLGAGELKLQGSGKIKLMGHGPNVKINAKIVFVSMALDIVPSDDGTNPKIANFKVQDVKGMEVKVSGMGPLNFFLNNYVKVVGRMFRNMVKSSIEGKLKVFLAKKIKDYQIPEECLKDVVGF